ncbi:MAG TPA: response regulator [Janthinobacterium sp.]|nr:response regulator [Janthinobacterium sp.]
MSSHDTVPPIVTKRLILLVDDDMLILGLLSQFLQRAGHDTRMATSGQMALDMLAETGHEPDLALLDISMPGMSGLELARRMQAETSVPLMFLSASENAEMVKQAAAYGAVGYLVKPIDMAQLSPSIAAALARGDEIRQLRETEIKLTHALRSGREIGMAIGVLMERYKTDRDTAFTVLRDHARSQRRKLNDVAQEVLASAEALNVFVDRFAEPGRIKR